MLIHTLVFLAALLFAQALADICPVVQNRTFWGAKPPKSVQKLKLPIPQVIIHHTERPRAANTTEKCIEDMKSIQRYHQNTRRWNDIGYNFAICGDNNIYEGRGWHNMGAQARGHNQLSIGIVFIGDYGAKSPSTELLNLAKNLIACGIERGYIKGDYILYGHRDVGRTLCPGTSLYDVISKWDHHKELHITDIINHQGANSPVQLNNVTE